jgi:stearoyl-CoA desaturase (delta-9 desaturase)
VDPRPTIPEKFSRLPLPPPGTGYDFIGFLPFVLVHVACLGALWTGARPIDWVICGAMYLVRTFAVMAGYHRYFSHRTFKTSRAFQFVLALAAETTGQKGVLWWASHHRNHHKFSDLPWDWHSPIQRGFWHSHLGWIAERGTEHTDLERVKDLAKYPELRWLDRHWMWPIVGLGFATYFVAGWSALFVGFFLSTVLTWHATFLVNSLSHVVGKRRFATEDSSRNHWLIALFTLGEGWHNNHHHCMGSVRQGFYWWEIDVTYYVLRMFAWCGLVWDLRLPTPEILAEGRARDAEARAGTRRQRDGRARDESLVATLGPVGTPVLTPPGP